MKTNMKRQSLLLFGWLLLATPAAVLAQFTYTTNNGGITITGYTGTSNVVVIPDTITGLPVTVIGDAFLGDTSLTSVIIPNSVTNIGDYAFSDCHSLRNVTIGTRVTNIGSDAFYYCTSLTSVIVPNSVTSIGDNAFGYCNSLRNVTIGTSVTNIGSEAFYSCTSLTSVIIPNSVASI